MGLPWWLSSKKSACNAGDRGGKGFIPGSGSRKLPWGRAWQPTPVFFPGESYGQRSLAGYSPTGSQRVGHDGRDWASTQAHSHAYPVVSVTRTSLTVLTCISWTKPLKGMWNKIHILWQGKKNLNKKFSDLWPPLSLHCALSIYIMHQPDLHQQK